MTSETDDAIIKLNAMAWSICEDINALMGSPEYSGVRPHILLTLAYMHAVRQYHEELRAKNPEAVAKAKEAANRVGILMDDNSADWIISQQPHEGVEIVRVLDACYVSLSSLMGTAQPLWAIFYDDLVDRWRKLDRFFGKKESLT